MTSSRGPRGYPDYQRVENYDGESLLTGRVFTTGKNIFEGEGPFDVSRYAAVKLGIKCTKGLGILTLRYLTYGSGGVNIGERKFVMSANSGSTAILEVANIGPEVVVFWEGLEASNSITLTMVPTNRAVTQVATPPTPLVAVSHKAYKPNETVSVPVIPLVTGTGHLQLEAPGSGVVAGRIEVTDETNTVRVIAAEFVEAGKGLLTIEGPLPPLPISLVISNGPTEQEILAAFMVG